MASAEGLETEGSWRSLREAEGSSEGSESDFGAVCGEVVREAKVSRRGSASNELGGQDEGERVIERVTGARVSDARVTEAEASAEAFFSLAEDRRPGMAAR